MASLYQRLLTQDFSELEEAARSWLRLAQQTETAVDTHRTKVTGPLHAEWEGEDADTALYYLEDVEKRLNTVRTEATTISTVLDTVQSRMRKAQSDLRAAVRAAEQSGFAVGDDGRVTDPEGNGGGDGQDPSGGGGRASALAQYQSQINKAVENARQASDDGVKALSPLRGDIMDSGNLDASSESARDVDEALEALGIEEPKIPKDPKDAAEWWKGLTPEERQRYETLFPALIGGTDGLPADTRDAANRLALEQELNALKWDRSVFGNATHDELNRRQHHLTLLLEELEKRDGTSPDKQLYLLDFDSRDDGKAVIAMGNPDTAAHTAVQVPGTDTTLKSTPGQLRRIEALQDAAVAAGAEGGVSTIWWLGYDAPEINTSVLGTGRAEDGAPDLRQFTAGLRASHQGDPTHLTVAGHSYGSTTVGAAASGGDGLQADDIIAVGSPGMTVGKASELNIDPDHVYVGQADDDWIDYAANKTLGKDPAEEGFGGKNFTVDTSGHSGYWDQGSQSLANMGRIIAGKEPSTVPKEDNNIPFIPGI